ncbi:hypothetical protein AVEN_79490-1 [Araneus ventricosus]|uniref:Uncharacterized protein n=1 Tax=Araneus ventricosus TaxID=182803 RepID=A0A4Y2S304_ARAVE|nr:hypothetical protein AVEN_79490-1 [Araneus ventricosus]
MPGRLRRMASRCPSDHFLFPKLEEHLYATRFSSGSDAKTAAENWLNGQGRDFCQAGLNRQSSTCLSRLASGHLKCLSYSEGNKIYPLCPKCQQHQASPKHILDCLGLDWEEIYSSPLLVIDFIKVNGFLDW